MAAHKSERAKGDRGIDDSDDNDKDDDDDNDDDDDDVHVHVHDDDDDDDDDVEIKDNQGTFSVCECEGKPHGDVSLTRGKGKDGSFVVCPQMTFFRSCRGSARAWSMKKQKGIP